MNKEFDYYMDKIFDISRSKKILKSKFKKFYEKYKNEYEFDDLMNINCQNCENSFCCINCQNCKECVFCEDCKHCRECKKCQNRKYCYDCKNLKSL